MKERVERDESWLLRIYPKEKKTPCSADFGIEFFVMYQCTNVPMTDNSNLASSKIEKRKYSKIYSKWLA